MLDNVREVVSLSQQEIEVFLSVVEVRLFKKKEFVLQSGDLCRNETFVNKGCLKVFYTDLNGTQHNVKFAPENWWSLDLESFATQMPAFYSIQAIEDSECFQISKMHHDWLYEKVPQLEKFAKLRYQNAYIMLQHRMTQSLFSTAEQKYDAFTRKYPGLELRISQKDIASYLGVTPEFLSMIRNKRQKHRIP
ncbi:Crp/Fnr family transcriptional regulator [Fulvivirgaceae bacterium PWU4]|uniref:Crp/Fnr family transcriptional regulator n=1 Tax=Chryseosolibacter histidini TaxID=2782349 RepID=A0AAP2GQ19_9BACT|nr:Crp/Fnr family transcriptional regulator [Chryseosolibacter histidini]MBT1698032.1 Crp/Fnr family transcriptional regulator [Chryseosolibacter histidini]